MSLSNEIMMSEEMSSYDFIFNKKLIKFKEQHIKHKLHVQMYWQNMIYYFLIVLTKEILFPFIEIFCLVKSDLTVSHVQERYHFVSPLMNANEISEFLW